MSNIKQTTNIYHLKEINNQNKKPSGEILGKKQNWSFVLPDQLCLVVHIEKIAKTHDSSRNCFHKEQ